MFLQGLFFRDWLGWPNPIDGVDPKEMVGKLKQLVIDCEKENMADHVISFSLSPANNFITCFLAGVDNLEQLAGDEYQVFWRDSAIDYWASAARRQDSW